MFWENGYQALAALDDNGDGWLTGPEFDGLGLWFDRSQNGMSDPGEVVSIEETLIEAIRVTADRREGDSWKSTAGLRLRNGPILPTWDWIPDLTTAPLVHDTERAINFSQPVLHGSGPLILSIPH